MNESIAFATTLSFNDTHNHVRLKHWPDSLSPVPHPANVANVIVQEQICRSIGEAENLRAPVALFARRDRRTTRRGPGEPAALFPPFLFHRVRFPVSIYRLYPLSRSTWKYDTLANSLELVTLSRVPTIFRANFIIQTIFCSISLLTQLPFRYETPYSNRIKWLI